MCLATLAASTPLAAAEKSPSALIVTGNDGPFHDWKKTTDALKDVLSADNAFDVTVVTDPEFLADPKLHGYKLVVLNYVNWKAPGLSEEARANFLKYLSGGGALAILHFANGAFSPDIPETKAGQWPEYAKICKRRWKPGVSMHDNFGRFEVEISDQPHPITQGLTGFETEDELYFKQQGDEPVTVLAVARSKLTGQKEPQAFAYNYEKARVFQTTLGHSGGSISNPGAAALIRRGCQWASGTLGAGDAAKEKPAK
ncbi:MAG: ThuA domain-containing protein [Planctomycetaceae bacterium]